VLNKHLTYSEITSSSKHFFKPIPLLTTTISDMKFGKEEDTGTACLENIDYFDMLQKLRSSSAGASGCSCRALKKIDHHARRPAATVLLFGQAKQISHFPGRPSPAAAFTPPAAGCFENHSHVYPAKKNP